MKKLILLPILFGLLSVGAGAFSDVSRDDWFYTDITALAELGVIDGFADGTFRPRETVTAAQFYKLLAVCAGAVTADDSGQPWYAPYEAWLAERGLLPENQDPDMPISKLTVVGMLARYYPDEGYPADLERLAEGFADYEEIPPEARRDALRMCYDGLVVGGGGRYRPDASLTRAEAATIIARVLDETRRQPTAVSVLPVDGMKAAQASGQIITVTVPTAKDYKATVNVYEQVEGVWLRRWRELPAVTGSRGVMKNRKQDTYTSPVGNYGFVFAFGAMENPGMHAGYEYRSITADSYWVLDKNHALYNRWTEGKGSFRHYERLVDFGYQYNYAMVIDFNYETPVKGDGGAIFLHVATTDGKGTGGCIAMTEEDLVGIMQWLDPEKNPRIIICTQDELGEY